MRVKVLFFGVLRDMTGLAEDSLEADVPATLGALFDRYAAQFPALRTVERSTVLARNQHFSNRSTLLEDGDEIAFLPPVSGGSSPYLSEIWDKDRWQFLRLNATRHRLLRH